MRAFIAAVLLTASHLAFAADISVEDAQIRQPMPGRTVTAGYLTLHNHTAADLQLVGVSSTSFDRAELHQHSHRDGMMRMEQVSAITVPAKGQVTLAPGGLHLMLFEPTAELEAGQSVALTLMFADGGQLAVTVPVVAMPKR